MNEQEVVESALKLFHMIIAGSSSRVTILLKYCGVEDLAMVIRKYVQAGHWKQSKPVIISGELSTQPLSLSSIYVDDFNIEAH